MRAIPATLLISAAMTSKLSPFILSLPVILLSLIGWRLFVSRAHPVAGQTPPAPQKIAAVLPVPQDRSGYVALDQDRVFMMPAGPKGLEYTPVAGALNGKKVRMTGWMVKHLHADPRIFLLHARPMVLNMKEYGLADDLPPSAPHVILPERPGYAPAWTRRKLEVCGTLELGPRQEADGRISHVRLLAEHVLNPADGSPVDVSVPVGLQTERLAAGGAQRESAGIRPSGSN